MDFKSMHDKVWAKTILAATYETVKQGGKIPPHIMPFVEKAMKIMEENKDCKCKSKN